VPFDRHLLEAKLALNLIASGDMPTIAWDALEAGLDGAATRRLAALEHPTYFEVAEVLPLVLQELELSQIPVEEAAQRMAEHVARDILQRRGDPLQHIRELETLWIRTDYAPELAALRILDDEVSVARTLGQPETEIRKWVTSTLEEFCSRPKT
jgi:hypothetical protein